jgi:hypothetical protein
VPSPVSRRTAEKTVFDPFAATLVIIVVGQGINAYLAETDHGHLINIIVARNPKEGVVQV